MPNRYIRASAIESEPVNALTPQAEVFYRRLLNRADDFGRFTANLRLLRSSLFPLQIDSVSERTVAACLAECVAVGLVFTYEADGKPLLVINKWEQGRAKHSDFAAPPADVCERMKTYVYTCKHMFAYAPDSDTDSDTDSDRILAAASATAGGVELFTQEPPVAPKPAAPKPPKETKPRPRDPLMDALATVGGGKAAEVTQWAPVAVAMKQIKAVAPELTPAEIERRAENYRTHYPDCALTPTALAKHWALCDTAKGGTVRDEFGSVRQSGWGTEIKLDRSQPENPDEPFPFN